jgi:fumarate reductase subunit C
MTGKQYIRPMKTNWWLEKKSYTLFMLREMTALFVAGYAAFLLVMVYYAGHSDAAFSRFVGALRSPVSMLLHLLALVAVLYHTVTWFGLLPKVAVLWRGEEKVPASVLIAANWAAWAVVTVVVAGLAVYAAGG